MEDGQIHPVRRESEVLAGALDWLGVGAKDLLAAVGLEDDDALTADQLRDEELGLRMRGDAAEGEPAAGGSEDEEGGEPGVLYGLLPHLLAAQVEGADDLEGVVAVATEGDELAAADEEGRGAAGGVEWRELAGFARVGVEIEGPVLAALVDDGEIAFGDGGDSDGESRTGCAGVLKLDLIGGNGRKRDAEEIDLDRGGVVLLLARIGVRWE